MEGQQLVPRGPECTAQASQLSRQGLSPRLRTQRQGLGQGSHIVPLTLQQLVQKLLLDPGEKRDGKGSHTKTLAWKVQVEAEDLGRKGVCATR